MLVLLDGFFNFERIRFSLIEINNPLFYMKRYICKVKNKVLKYLR